jgi:ABC-2 type transport system permease protein
MIQPSLAVPGKGPAAVTGQLWATMRAELLMQWRRWGLWLAFGVVLAIMSLIFISKAANFKYEPHANGPYRTLDEFMNLYLFVTVRYSATLTAIIAALLVADRMVRDQRLGMAELQRVTSEGYPVYVLGKFIGNFVAMLVPAFVVLMSCGVAMVALGFPLQMLQSLVEAFVLVFIPAFAVVIALTLLLASMVPLRVVQIGFPLLWLYSTESPLGWHTLNDTIFNPVGRYICPVFFPALFDKIRPGIYTFQLAMLNITVLLTTALVSLVLLVISLAVQAHREAAD